MKTDMSHYAANLPTERDAAERFFLHLTPEQEAELEARRCRSNKISERMAFYLLMGYAMRADYCEACGTVLLRNRRTQEDYCVACQEVDRVLQDNPLKRHSEDDSPECITTQEHVKRRRGFEDEPDTEMVDSN
eukprot:Colp12_sorted_trinity150504_noHs@36563